LNNVTILQLKCESNDDYNNYIFSWDILLVFNENLNEKISATIETHKKENIFNIYLKTPDSINITAKCCVKEFIIKKITEFKTTTEISTEQLTETSSETTTTTTTG
jgi:hypothetical protein